MSRCFDILREFRYNKTPFMLKLLPVHLALVFPFHTMLAREVFRAKTLVVSD
jgi:hypothetical protein